MQRFLLLLLAFLPAFVYAQAQPRVLVFSKTVAFRHASIEPGKIALIQLGKEKGFAVDTSEDASVFNEANLKRYAAVIWLSTTGNALDFQQQNAFERYIQAGGGYVGIHAASDTEYDWPWYGKLVGGWFDNHPSQPSNVQQGTFHIADKTNPLTSFLPEPWVRTDEFYAYKKMNPAIKVLITIDEKSYIGGTMGDYHPMSWYHEYDGGRAFYTNMGHTNETFSEPLFLQHLWAGLQWAMNTKLDYSKVKSAPYPEENRFTKVVLEEKLDEPMELAVLPDKKVLFIQRKGEIKLYEPAVGKSRTVATLPVSTKYLPDSTGNRAEAEDGLLGLTLDPNFANNHWIYLYYSPEGDEAVNTLARFEFKNDELVLNSKKELLKVNVQRQECCHTAGSMGWDRDGNLYLSTGDNSSPRADGYAPIDERPGRSPWDAQKSSGNTNDLRGKILRIHPETDGSYSIPTGNLFPKGTPKTRPEIYTMGHRNPFRISVDPQTGYVYWGEVGPDANDPSDSRGPRGYDEVGQARHAGNFGWPYHIGDNQAYLDYDYASKQTGAAFSIDKPVNNSPNNTGLQELPPAQKAFIWYPYAESADFPLVGTGGRNAMAGPVFHSNDFKSAARAWPAYYDGKLFIYDWMRGWMMAVTMDKNGDYSAMEPIMPTYRFSNPMDMVFANDGDLYMLEYGTGWFQANDDARLVRIEYNAGNRKPAIQATADKTSGSIPLMVHLTADGTKDFDGDVLQYKWTVAPKAGGKKQTFKTANAAVTLAKAGEYVATLEVTDAKGAKNTQSIDIVAGNESPELTFDLSGSNTTFFFPGKKIKYDVRVQDKEDGSLADGRIDPAQVSVNFDYLPEGYDKIAIAQGHRFADGNARFATAQKIMDGLDCKACHKPAEKSIGPSFKDVATKYKDDAGAVNTLSQRIIQGSSGVWGQVAMAAHPSLSAADATTLVNYILSFSDEKAHPAPLPVRGEYMPTLPEGDAGAGAFLLRAAYKDRGAGALPSLTSEKSYLLRSSQYNAHEMDEIKGVQKMSFSGMKLCLVSNGNWVAFKGVDLTDVVQIQLQATAPKKFNFAGGRVVARLDKEDGTVAGTSDALVPSEEAGFASTTLKIVLNKGLSGKHDVYLVFQNDTSSTSQTLCAVTSFVFQDQAMATAAPASAGGGNGGNLADFAGKYKFTGLPFEAINITLEDGVLMIQAGTDKGPLTPISEGKFDAGGKATIEFVRENGKVTTMKLMPPGMRFEGKKE